MEVEVMDGRSRRGGEEARDVGYANLSLDRK